MACLSLWERCHAESRDGEGTSPERPGPLSLAALDNSPEGGAERDTGIAAFVSLKSELSVSG